MLRWRFGWHLSLSQPTAAPEISPNSSSFTKPQQFIRFCYSTLTAINELDKLLALFLFLWDSCKHCCWYKQLWQGFVLLTAVVCNISWSWIQSPGWLLGIIPWQTLVDASSEVTRFEHTCWPHKVDIFPEDNIRIQQSSIFHTSKSSLPIPSLCTRLIWFQDLTS